MSSGFVSKNGDIIGFEINHNYIQGQFTMTLLPPEFDMDGEQRVSIKLTTQAINSPDQMVVTNQVTITKPYTKVLAHFFRHMAEHMDKWYDNPTISSFKAEGTETAAQADGGETPRQETQILPQGEK